GQVQEEAMDELIRLKCDPDYAMRAAHTSNRLVKRAAKPRTVRQAEIRPRRDREREDGGVPRLKQGSDKPARPTQRDRLSK
ncbi:MAG: hypothetical protein ABFD84_05815, partial [Candidatus Polarisedimenticolia bacterium]